MPEYEPLASSTLSEGQLPAVLGECRNATFSVARHGRLRVCGEPRHGRLLFAHGAGAGMDSPFMRQFVTALASYGVQTLSFDFAYMQQIQETGKRRPPPKMDVLVDELRRWQALIQSAVAEPLWLGGKSMGGRVASLLAAQQPVDGLMIAGYPFHPPRRPEKLRLAHWPQVSCPALIIQGERDPFGTRHEVETYTLPPNARLVWLADGDHDFVPRRASGMNQQILIDEAAHYAASFVRVESRNP
ncbi:alpha/beta fold hydrolase [Vreelandella subglaciescola]|jgi:hypothetical protein|uniref:KANL3/Tex30 alpha/beta hydrolase-like domain-containing protein n=1 Tax=Vreelandella subglaciescola TaxID=29571 RepID=A0A1M7HYD3_9GAMM|nr:alpha/beta fold hydrolase [Halomonas subglaciescola]SHM33418.1 hypothetical protein SAMN05878437_2422 [Halomonas subglaciescola]